MQCNDSERVCEVLEHFDIGGVRRITPIKQDFLNTVYGVESSIGQWVLKRHWFRRGLALRLMSLVLQTLENARFPADYLVHTRNGGWYVTDDTDAFTLHKFLKGRNFRKPQCLHAGILDACASGLAHLHATLWECALPITEVPSTDIKLPIIFSASTSTHLHLLSYLMDHWPKNCGQEAPYRLFDEWRHMIECVDFGSIPWIPVHGDFRFPNLIFNTRNEFGGVFDWDFLQKAPRLVDLCGNLFCELLVGRPYFPTYLSEPHLVFIRAYQKAATERCIGLSEAEVRAIPAFTADTAFRHWFLLSVFADQIPQRDNTNSSMGSFACRRIEEGSRIFSAINKLPSEVAAWVD